MSNFVYAIRNVAGDYIYLNDPSLTKNPVTGSLTLSDDNFQFDNDIVENSALPGGVKLGSSRLTTRSIQIKFSRAENDSSDFQFEENYFMAALNEATHLVDVTNSREVPIAVNNYNIVYDQGCYQRSSDNVIDLLLLEPFWTYISETTITDSLLIDANPISISSLGDVDHPGIITLTADTAVTRIQMYVDETKQGIQIEDNLFGTGSHTELIIDNRVGELNLGQYNRVNSIIPGTGFFNFPYTASTLIVIPDAICDIEIKMRRREYV